MFVAAEADRVRRDPAPDRPDEQPAEKLRAQRPYRQRRAGGSASPSRERPALCAQRRSPASAPFAWDGRRLLYEAGSCATDFLAQHTFLAGPYRGPVCDVRVLSVTRLGKRRLRVVVSCRPGCRDGEVDFGLGRRCGVNVARLNFRRPGVRVITVQLRPWALRLLRLYRRVPFRVEAIIIVPELGLDVGTSDGGLTGTLPGDGTRHFAPRRGRCTPVYDPTI